MGFFCFIYFFFYLEEWDSFLGDWAEATGKEAKKRRLHLSGVSSSSGRSSPRRVSSPRPASSVARQINGQRQRKSPYEKCPKRNPQTKLLEWLALLGRVIHHHSPRFNLPPPPSSPPSPPPRSIDPFNFNRHQMDVAPRLPSFSIGWISVRFFYGGDSCSNQSKQFLKWNEFLWNSFLTFLDPETFDWAVCGICREIPLDILKYVGGFVWLNADDFGILTPHLLS